MAGLTPLCPKRKHWNLPSLRLSFSATWNALQRLVARQSFPQSSIVYKYFIIFELHIGKRKYSLKIKKNTWYPFTRGHLPFCQSSPLNP